MLSTCFASFVFLHSTSFDQQSHVMTMHVHVPQAEKPSWNSIGIFKVSNITGKRREPVPKLGTDDTEMDGEDSDSDDDSEEEDEGGAQGPSLQETSSSFEFLLFHFLTASNPMVLTF